jgi:Karyopherin (importin) alpha
MTASNEVSHFMQITIFMLSCDVQGDLSITYKKIVRLAQHTIAKLLVTTNPSLLSTTQCMGSIKPLLLLVKDHESSDLQKFEALLSITNLASFNHSTKDHIVGENGISILSYAMFSNHDMVRRAATEAMSNLIPHPKLFEYLRNQDKLKVWVAFASDFESNFECSRAALGCLAMVSQDLIVANELTMIDGTRSMIKNTLECGRLELMQRVLVLVLNLQEHGGNAKIWFWPLVPCYFARHMLLRIKTKTM